MSHNVAIPSAPEPTTHQLKSIVGQVATGKITFFDLSFYNREKKVWETWTLRKESFLELFLQFQISESKKEG